MIEQIKGDIMGLVFEGENGFKIYCVACESGEVTIKGTLPDLFEGEGVEVTGELVHHNIYGDSINVTSLKIIYPTKKSNIITFLSSGIIPGVGAATAKAIFNQFGTDTIDIILNSPERLIEVSGLSEKKRRKIAKNIKEHKAIEDVISYFGGLGVSSALAMKAYMELGPKVCDVVNVNPYFPSTEVSGFTFPVCDKMAEALNFPPDSVERTKASIIHQLGESYNSGHVCLPESVLVEAVNYQTNSENNQIDEALSQLIDQRLVYVTEFMGEKRVYLRYLFDAERYIEKKLVSLAYQKVHFKTKNIEKAIDTFEAKQNIKLDDMQKLAVESAGKEGFLVITGGPGTGKTTIINGIINVLAQEGKTCLLAAPTGRAAKRMSVASGKEAKTIHRLLEVDYSVENENFVRNDRNIAFKKKEGNPLECDCLILDEASMIDTLLMFHLLKALSPNTTLILVGDKDQLPSVGPGRILCDIINSNLFQVVTLEKIYRQNPNSIISFNAHNVNLGQMPDYSNPNGDFFFINCENARDCTSLVSDLVARRLPLKYNIDAMTDIQVITPNRKGNSGSVAFSQAIQEVLNPKKGYNEEILSENGGVFRVNDRVMQIKNDYDLSWEDNDDASVSGEGVFNGEMGVITKIDKIQKLVYVLFDDNRIVIYDKLKLNEIELSYAITVHKSQGSEFDYCIIPIVGVYPTLKTRNLIYTAITRAKKMVVLVGKAGDLYQMIKNDKEELRYTTLFIADRVNANEN